VLFNIPGILPGHLSHPSVEAGKRIFSLQHATHDSMLQTLAA
jgi:hypothetical protein